MKAPGDAGERGIEGKREIKHPDRAEREWRGGRTDIKKKERGEKICEPTIFIAFIEMLRKKQNEMDLIKHHLYIATVYLCDCVYIHNKWFKLVLAVCIFEIVSASLGV